VTRFYPAKKEHAKVNIRASMERKNKAYKNEKIQIQGPRKRSLFVRIRSNLDIIQTRGGQLPQSR
jgi:hypothetical protein